MSMRRSDADKERDDSRESVFANRRRVGRIDCVMKGTIRVLGRPSTPARTRVVDLSEDGLCIVTRRRLRLEDRISIDLECDLPMRVHLGFDADALVIDGPMHTHLVRVEATVRQVQRIGPRLLRIGVAFDHASALDDYQLIAHFVDHLRERAGWAI